VVKNALHVQGRQWDRKNKTGQESQERTRLQERAENNSTVKTTLGKGKDNLTLQQQGQDVCSSRDRKFAVAETGRLQ
jgi:hypothetical protein